MTCGIDAEVPGQLVARAERALLQADRRHDDHRHDEEEDQPQAARDAGRGRAPAGAGDATLVATAAWSAQPLTDLVEEVVPLPFLVLVSCLYW